MPCLHVNYKREKVVAPVSIEIAMGYSLPTRRLQLDVSSLGRDGAWASSPASPRCLALKRARWPSLHHGNKRAACLPRVTSQEEYNALDWDYKFPLEAVAPHTPTTPAASPKAPHAEGGAESLV